MSSLLERQIAAVEHRLVVVAPAHAVVPGIFRNLCANSLRHKELIHEMQTLRGSVYLADGALRADELTPDGRHETPDDARSWHLLTVDDEHRVSGCVWYLPQSDAASIDQLRIGKASVARDPAWRGQLDSAVAAQIARARREGVGYGEVGGWAISNDGRRTPDGLMLILAMFGLLRLFGGPQIVSTATSRNASAAILRKLGGSPFQCGNATVPPYYDENYRCEMELLQFDSRRSSEKYNFLIDRLSVRLATALVVSNAPAAAAPAGRQMEMAAA